ncbi:MAG: hypothetical protein HC908_11925, partial [Calothrix sp. SM1_7_51]|nr:hypothetical protein [Calothrix sp. SM1_7_51]
MGDSTFKPVAAGSAAVPSGAIRETTFLDGRQIKAIHVDTSITNPGVETFTNRDGVNGDGNGTIANFATQPNYDYSRESRQPLEIRATVLDINALRKKEISGGVTKVKEFLVPNSGLIYATRDDALLDLSAEKSKSTTLSNVEKEEQQKSESSQDFILDPTRRPNAIMLVNGEELARVETYRDEEKGFILAS